MAWDSNGAYTLMAVIHKTGRIGLVEFGEGKVWDCLHMSHIHTYYIYMI